MDQVTVQSTAGRTDLAEISYQLRYRGYHHGGFIPENLERRFADAYDGQEGNETLLAYVNDAPRGTIRLVRKQPHHPIDKLVAAAAFREALAEAIPDDAHVLEINRLVIDPECTTHRKQLKIALFQAAFQRTVEEGFQYVLAAVRDEHQEFYMRTFGARPLGFPRVYPGLSCKMQLLVADFTRTAPARTTPNTPHAQAPHFA